MDYSLASTMKELMVALDEKLRCPICQETLRAPVVSCENGHAACSECTEDLDTCSLCDAGYSGTSMRVLEQVLELLPEPCIYADKGCSETAVASHSLYCQYRPIKCFLGPDSSCDWLGTVRDWVDHAKHSSTHKNKHSVEFSSPDVAKTLKYEAFSNWTSFGVFYYINNNYFLVFAIKREDMLHVTVRHIPVCKTGKKYFLETTILDNSKYVLYKVLQMASLFSGNERFENHSTCFSLDKLRNAIVNDSLVVSREFIKH